MNERIKLLRKQLGLSQGEFAQKLGMKQTSISNYEIGRNEPMPIAIKLICDTFGVNEAWLRDGVGDMFRPVSKQDEIAAYVADILGDENAVYQRKLILYLSRLSPECRNELERVAAEILGE